MMSSIIQNLIQHKSMQISVFSLFLSCLQKFVSNMQIITRKVFSYIVTISRLQIIV